MTTVEAKALGEIAKRLEEKQSILKTMTRESNSHKVYVSIGWKCGDHTDFFTEEQQGMINLLCKGFLTENIEKELKEFESIVIPDNI